MNPLMRLSCALLGCHLHSLIMLMRRAWRRRERRGTVRGAAR